MTSPRESIAFFLGVLAALCLSTGTTIGQVFVVTNLLNDGPGSLRQGLNSLRGLPRGKLDLTGLRGTLTITSALPEIQFSGEIVGPGTNLLALDGGYLTRFFSIPEGITQRISGLTFTRGYPGGDEHGGAIHTEGDLILESCSFQHNRTSGGFGGAIYSAGQLSILHSRFEGNTALGGSGEFLSGTDGVAYPDGAQGGFGAGMGGALFVEKGWVDIDHTSFVENQAMGGGSSSWNSNGSSALGRESGRGGGANGGTATNPAGFGGGGAAGVFPAGNGGFGGGGAGGANGSRQVGRSAYGGGNGDYGVSPGGTGISAGEGGAGGGFGGALFLKDGNTRIFSCRFLSNSVAGGIGRRPGGSFGGGLYIHSGSLIISNSHVAANVSKSSSVIYYYDLPEQYVATPATHGGGMHIHMATVTVQSSSFVGNLVQAPFAGAAYGGGLSMDGGICNILNSTFSSNRGQGERGHLVGGFFGYAFSYPGGAPQGAAIGLTNGFLTLTHCTIWTNSSVAGDHAANDFLCDNYCLSFRTSAGAGGLAQLGGQVQLRASIVGGNYSTKGNLLVPYGLELYPGTSPSRPESSDIEGPVESLGYNLIQLLSVPNMFGSTDILGIPPNLEALDYHGGITASHWLRPTSPGINSVPVPDLPEADQVGTHRPQGPYGEIGAVEIPGNTSIPRIIVGPAFPKELEYRDRLLITGNVWQGPAGASLQWLKDGAPVLYATNLSVVIHMASQNDSGQWSLRLTNADGGVTFGPVQVRVRRPALKAHLDWVALSHPPHSNTTGVPLSMRTSRERISFVAPRNLTFSGVETNRDPAAWFLTSFSSSGEFQGSTALQSSPSSPFEPRLLQNATTGPRILDRMPTEPAAGTPWKSEGLRISSFTEEGHLQSVITNSPFPLETDPLQWLQTASSNYLLLSWAPGLVSDNATATSVDLLGRTVWALRWKTLFSFSVAFTNSYLTAGRTSDVPSGGQDPSQLLWGETSLIGSNGKERWRQPILGLKPMTPVLCAACSNSAFVFISGAYQNPSLASVPIRIQFGNTKLTSTVNTPGSVANYLIHLDVQGNIRWIREVTTTRLAEFPALAADALGNSYVMVEGLQSSFQTGEQGKMSPDYRLDCGCSAVAIVKYSPLGEVVWSSAVHPPYPLQQTMLLPDESGGSYLAAMMNDRQLGPLAVEGADFGRSLSLSGSAGYRWILGRISAQPKMLASQLGEAGKIGLAIIGEPSQLYQVDYTRDFSNWSFLRTGSDPNGLIEFEAGGAAEDPEVFYRARQISP